MVHVLLAVPLAGQLADTWECGLEWYTVELSWICVGWEGVKVWRLDDTPGILRRIVHGESE